jgi:hypothetical protein
MRDAGVARLVLSDSLPPPAEPVLALEIVPLAPLLARALRQASVSA